MMAASLGYAGAYLLSRQVGGSVVPALLYFLLSEAFMVTK